MFVDCCTMKHNGYRDAIDVVNAVGVGDTCRINGKMISIRGTGYFVYKAYTQIDNLHFQKLLQCILNCLSNT